MSRTPGLERGLARSRPLLEKPLVLRNEVDLCRQRAAYGEQISHLIRINFVHTAGDQSLVEDDGGMQFSAAATSQRRTHVETTDGTIVSTLETITALQTGSLTISERNAETFSSSLKSNCIILNWHTYSPIKFTYYALSFRVTTKSIIPVIWMVVALMPSAQRMS